MFHVPMSRLLVLAHTAVGTGDLVLYGVDDDRVGWLLWLGPDGERRTCLREVMARAPEHPYPTLLAHPGRGVVVVVDPGLVFVVDSPTAQPRALRVSGPTPTDGRGRALVLAGGSAVSDEPVWEVVLSDPLLQGDLRFAATLAVDLAAGSARWAGAPWQLRVAEFPGDLPFEPADPRASIGATLRAQGVLHACSEGSLIRSNHSGGSDFFSCVTLDAARHVVDRLFEDSGWKHLPGKTAIRGRFTADGRYLILAPVFRTGFWKGRTHLLDLTDGSLTETRMPRGLTGATVLDHHPGSGWWVERDSVYRAVPTILP